VPFLEGIRTPPNTWFVGHTSLPPTPTECHIESLAIFAQLSHVPIIDADGKCVGNIHIYALFIGDVAQKLARIWKSYD